jgi:plasmid maintenance system killer protein
MFKDANVKRLYETGKCRRIPAGHSMAFTGDREGQHSIRSTINTAAISRGKEATTNALQY